MAIILIWSTKHTPLFIFRININLVKDCVALGATSIENITKISASGRNFLDPLPPLFEKGPTDENVVISYLIVIIKFGFF